jgi:hypothetical protein
VRIAVPVMTGLAGLTALATGAYIRSCTMAEAPMHTIWCGKAPSGFITVASQTHCAGCILAVAGLLVVIGSGVMAALAGQRRASTRGRA